MSKGYGGTEGESDESASIDRRRFLRGALGTGLVATVGFTWSGRVAGAVGETVWTFETGEAVEASPTVVGGTVYIGSDDGNLYALDAGTGDEQWAFETSRDIRGAANVVDGTVYVKSGAHVYALDSEDGAKLWTHRVGFGRQTAPTVVDRTVYVGSSSGTVYALDATNGTAEWTFEAEDTVLSSAAIVDGVVFIGSNDGTLYALDAATGEQAWTFGVNGESWPAPTVAAGIVYTGSADGNVYAVDATTGAEVWRFQTGDDVHSSPTVAGSTVYIGSDDQNLYALDADTGAEQWAFETGGFVDSSPTVADGTVYVGSWDNTLYGVDATTGDQRWAFETGQAIDSSPTVVDGIVYVGSEDGTLYAVETGGSGSSEDSRILLGALGHTEDWRYADQRIPVGLPSVDTSVTADSGTETTVEPDLDVSAVLTLEELRITPETDGEFDVTVIASGEPLDSTPAVPMLTEDEQLGFLSVDSDLPDEDIVEVTFRYTVDSSTVEGPEDDPDEMALYRYEDDVWVAHETELVGEADGILVYETTAPGLSEWTAGSSRPDISVTEAETDVSTVQTGEQFDIDVVLSNPDPAAGVYVTKLFFDGKVVDQQRVTVPAENSLIATFTRSVAEEGEYTVTVNDVEVGTVTVSDGTVTEGPDSTGTGTAEQTGESGDDSEIPWPLVAGGVGSLGILGGGGYLLTQRRDGTGPDEE